MPADGIAIRTRKVYGEYVLYRDQSHSLTIPALRRYNTMIR